MIAGKSVTIVDTVTLDGLKKGTKYQLKGWQMVKSENTQLLIDGKSVESDYSFTAKDSKWVDGFLYIQCQCFRGQRPCNL